MQPTGKLMESTTAEAASESTAAEATSETTSMEPTFEATTVETPAAKPAPMATKATPMAASAAASRCFVACEDQSSG
jgi:hypothetical protein